MDSSRFQRVMEVFEQAVALPDAARAAYVEQELSDEPATRDEVLGLLKHHQEESSGMSTGVGLKEAGVALIEQSKEALLPPLRGEYRILRTIGEGGMGVVFEAEQAFPRRRVALKALRPGFATPSMLRRFRNEAEFLARLQHPGIAQVFEAGVADADHPDQAYCVMELVDGEPLGAFASRHRLGVVERWKLLAQVCEAMQHAHSRGVIHRDLKPANILITREGEPKIVDFGIARAAEPSGHDTHATRAGQVIGTPAYMSPEQLSSGEVSTRSDIYSIGVIAYELLTGRLPIDTTEVPLATLANRVATAEPEPASRLNRSLKGDGETIIAKAMAKEPGRRYASAGELADDIRRMLNGEAILARRDSGMYILSRQVRRHRAAAAVVGIGLVSLVAFAVYATLKAQKEAKLALAALQSQREAENARVAADAANVNLAAELRQSMIERARLEGSIGNIVLAEDVLWSERKNEEGQGPAYWGLWELYSKYPFQWTTRASTAPFLAVGSPAGSRLVIASRAGELFAHSTADGSVVERVAGLTGITSMVMLDETIAVVGFGDGTLARVDTAKADSREPWVNGVQHAGGVRCMTLSEDGAWLATGGADKMVRVFDVKARKEIAAWEAHPDWLLAMAFSPDGKMLATSSRQVPAVDAARVWDAQTGKLIRGVQTKHFALVGGLCFSADARFLLIGGSDRILAMLNMTNGDVTYHPSPRNAPITAIARSRQGQEIAVSGADDLLSGPDLLSSRALGRQRFPAIGMTWRDEHTLVLVTTDGVIRSIDTSPEAAFQPVTGFTSWCFVAGYTADGSELFILDGNGKLVKQSPDGQREIASTQIDAVKMRARGLGFLDDDQTIVAGCIDGSIRMFDRSTLQPKGKLKNTTAEVFGMLIDSKRQRIIAGHADGVIRVWNVATGEATHTLPKLQRRVEAIAMSPDGTLIASSGGNDGIALWDGESLEKVADVKTSVMPWGVCFRPDGKDMAMSSYQGVIEVIDVATRRTRLSVKGHSRLVPAIAYSPDGKILATGDEHGLVKIWDSSTLRPLATLEPTTGEVVTIAFDPTGRYMAATSAMRMTAVYDLRGRDQCIAGNAKFHNATAE